MAGVTWDYVLKFIIAGDVAVGKTSLLIRLTGQRLVANLHHPTSGVEFGSKLITIPEDGKIVKLQCWDTAGIEAYRPILPLWLALQSNRGSYYRGAAGCLLVYDVTSRSSFMNARIWLADVRDNADPHLTCILVGNKVDLCAPSSSAAADTITSTSASPRHFPRNREVPTEEAAAWAQSKGLLFVEASANGGENVEDAFVRATRDILEKIRRGEFDYNPSPGVKLSNGSGTASDGCCC